jgi:hypothetical protein
MMIFILVRKPPELFLFIKMEFIVETLELFKVFLL